MQYFAALSTLISLASADYWALYCGSDCSNGTMITAGGFAGASIICANLTLTYDYCYLEADASYFKAVLLEGNSCGISDGDQETSLYAGECTSNGTWHSYMMTLNL